MFSSEELKVSRDNYKKLRKSQNYSESSYDFYTEEAAYRNRNEDGIDDYKYFNFNHNDNEEEDFEDDDLFSDSDW